MDNQKFQISDNMVTAGITMSRLCYSVQVAKSLTPESSYIVLESLTPTSLENRDLVLSYINGEIANVTAIYVAMERARGN